MSSLTPWTQVDVKQLPIEGEAGGAGPSVWQSPRQLHLARLYRAYRCQQYDERSLDWDGYPVQGSEQGEAIARTGFLPAGFEQAQDQLVPLQYRKPCAPVHLGRAVPLKLSAMLFGSDKHPKLACDDPLTEDWLTGFAEATRLWSRMKQARNQGGAMGSTCLGFSFVQGKPKVEVHDPRWCTPTFVDRSELIVQQLEKRYQYRELVQTAEGVEERWFWYRRIIDHEVDVVWPKVAVGDEEPDWLNERYQSVAHGHGRCPVVWVQNQPVEEEVDGDPDLHGCWDVVESVDMLYSQARHGTLANMDPTLGISSDAEFGSLKKGSGNAVQTEKGGSLNYLELTGAGIKLGMDLAESLIEKVEIVARVSLDRNNGGPSRTVEEVEHNYSSMLENCDELREQYGELGVKRLLEMVLEAARRLSGVRVDQSAELPRIVRSVIQLPKRRVKDPDTGKVTWVERQLGEGQQIELQWPEYYAPSQESVVGRVTAAGQAKTFGLIDSKHATEYVAKDFDIENVGEALKKIASEQGAAGAAGNDLAETVAQRSLSGARSALPSAGAKQLAAVARKAAG